MKRYKMTFTALSPIHIGTGEEISPFEYVIINMGTAGYFFVSIDLPCFLAQLDQEQRRQFDYATNQSNMGYLRKFIARNADPLRNPAYKFYDAPVSEKLAKLYFDKLDSPVNQLIINPCMRLPGTWRPYIPGSSLKGAIRTAVVSILANKKWAASEKDKVRRKRGNDFEAECLQYGQYEDSQDKPRFRKDLRRDPFRALLVEDITLPNDATYIDATEIKRQDGSSATAGLQQYYERTWCLLEDEEISGSGVMTIKDELAEDKFSPSKRRFLKGLPRIFDALSLADLCRKFYLPKMRQEYDKFYRRNEKQEQNIKPLLEKFGREEHYGPLEFPVRLGHFSHCECVTIDNFRQPKTRRGKNGRPLPSGTTRTLAEGNLPFGWAKISLELLD